MANIRLFKNTSVYTIGSLGQKAGRFLLLPLYTTYLSGSEFGAIALILLTVSFLTDFIQYPIGTGLLRFYYDPKHNKDRDKLIYSLLLIGLMASIVFVLIFLLLDDTIANLLWDSKSSIGYLELVTLVDAYAPIIVIQPVSSYCLTILRIREQAKYYAIVSVIGITIEIGIAFIGLIFLGWGIFTPIYAQMGGLIVVVILILPVIFRNYSYQWSYRSSLAPLRYSLPLLPSAYSEILVKSGDRYLIKMLISLNATGVYSVAYQIAGGIEFALSKPLEQAFQPMALKLEGKPDQLKRFTQESMYAFTFIGGIIALALSIYSQDILKVFARGEEFWVAWNIIPVIALSFLFKGIAKFSGMGLIMKKKSGLQSLGMIIAAVLNVIFNFIFIPFYGIFGAALATMISYLFWNFWKAYFTYKYYSLSFNWVKVFLILLIGIAVFMVNYLFLNGYSLYTSLFLKAVLILGFVVIVWFSSLLSIGLKKYILQIINKVKLKVTS